ncbi:MAG: hypothetical protein E7665_00445 [Ruminococcaceae bacterium]|nr:hypothetical protein [Oscillospiraceae bacterium]
MKTGFARVDITPFCGIGLSGYFNYRFNDGYLDPLYASAVAVSDGEKTAVLMSVDIIGIPMIQEWLPAIAESAGVPKDAVMVACTHTHTAPSLRGGDHDPKYNEFLLRRLCDAAKMAVADLTNSKIYTAHSKVYDIAFIRRFRMKNGEVKTNPGIFNPDIVAPIGEPDPQLQAVLIKREGKKDILLVQYQVHPDVIGGTKASADFPGFCRSTVETLEPNMYCVYFNGCQGDTNHINVAPHNGKAWGGYEHSKSMGRIIALSALGALDKLTECDDGKVSFMEKFAPVPLKNTDEEAVKEAKEFLKDKEEGNVYSGGNMTNLGKVTLSRKILRFAGMKELDLPVCGIAFSDICFVSMPGEPFTEIGRQIKKASEFKTTFVCCCANGYEGYLPTSDAFEASAGYEATSSIYTVGTAETLINTGIEIVKSCR